MAAKQSLRETMVEESLCVRQGVLREPRKKEESLRETKEGNGLCVRQARFLREAMEWPVCWRATRPLAASVCRRSAPPDSDGDILPQRNTGSKATSPPGSMTRPLRRCGLFGAIMVDAGVFGVPADGA